jgi:thiamine-phosphate pyrophosphorylase
MSTDQRRNIADRLRVYLVADPTATLGRPLDTIVAEAVRGGVSLVQLRVKAPATRSFVEQARALVALLRPLGVPLVINDRVDVALAVGADGVHVGQRDMPAADARRLLGPDAILGVSATDAEQLRAVDAAIADYVGIGPVFATGSKADASTPLGLDGLAALCRLSPLPVVAIGGIGVASARAVVACGAAGVSVISAICGAPDPAEAARALRADIESEGR